MSKISVPAGLVLGESLLPGLADDLLIPAWWRERGTIGLFSFCIRSLIPSRGSTLMTLQ